MAREGDLLIWSFQTMEVFFFWSWYLLRKKRCPYIGPPQTSRFSPKLVVRNDPEYSGSSPDHPELIRNNPDPFRVVRNFPDEIRNPNRTIFEVTSEFVRTESGIFRTNPDEFRTNKSKVLLAPSSLVLSLFGWFSSVYDLLNVPIILCTRWDVTHVVIKHTKLT